MMTLYGVLYRHRTDRNIWIAALFVHLIFILAWRLTGEHLHREIERRSVTVTMIFAVVFYLVLVFAFWKAQKTRLNKALALNKLFWGLLISTIGLPAQTGWYTPAPQWFRAYIWVGITITLAWVLWEFVNTNWMRKDEWPWVERRVLTRREADRVLSDELAWYRRTYGPRVGS